MDKIEKSNRKTVVGYIKDESEIIIGYSENDLIDVINRKKRMLLPQDAIAEMYKKAEKAGGEVKTFTISTMEAIQEKNKI